jgi:hypothetical protein
MSVLIFSVLNSGVVHNLISSTAQNFVVDNLQTVFHT